MPIRQPTPQSLLDAWEAALAAPRDLRAAHLVAALSGVPAETVLARLLSEVDRELIALREHCFGERLQCLADCPACGETLELEFGTGDIPLADPAAGEHRCVTASCEVTFTLPTLAQLMRTTAQEAVDAGRRRLLMDSIVAARCADRSVPPEALSSDVLEAVEQAMEAADPGALPEVALVCPACAHGWASPIDVGSFVWREVDAWAERTLDQVAMLARGYGWSEAEILAMSAARRQRYLDRLWQ
jgi:hypothetical protein